MRADATSERLLRAQKDRADGEQTLCDFATDVHVHFPPCFLLLKQCCFQLVEIGGQKVRPGGAQLLAASVAVENADGLKAVGMRPGPGGPASSRRRRF